MNKRNAELFLNINLRKPLNMRKKNEWNMLIQGQKEKGV